MSFFTIILKKHRFRDILIKSHITIGLIDMRFDLSKEVARIAEEWNQVIFDKESAHDWDMDLYGPKGSGKTKAAQELANSHTGIYYVSFEGLSYDAAVQSFVSTYLPGTEGISSISDAVDHFLKKRSGKRTLIIVENENSDVMQEFIHSFPIQEKRKSIVLCFIRNEQCNYDHAVRIWHRSPADFIKAFPEYDKNDAVRLQALTGGTMAVAKELDQGLSYEDCRGKRDTEISRNAFLGISFLFFRELCLLLRCPAF